MKLLLLLFVIGTAHADISDCIDEVSQLEKDQCATFERNKAIGGLMKKITRDCLDEPDVKASQGGTIYSMLVDECIEKKVEKISEELN